MRFTQFYAGAPVCAPSRCALMTGLHNGHGRVRDNIPHGVFLQIEDVTLAEVLRGEAIAPGGSGSGASESWLGGHTVAAGLRLLLRLRRIRITRTSITRILWENDRVVLLPGNRGERKQQYTADLFAERAVRFIEENRRAALLSLLRLHAAALVGLSAEVATNR